METGTRNLRLFVALEPSEQVRSWLSALQERIRREHSDSLYRWVALQNLHVTLHFLGDTPAEGVGTLSAAVKEAAGHIEPLSLIASGLGFFPSERRPRVLWCGITEGGERLAGLHRALGEAISGAGFSVDPRPLHAHFTLAYVRKNAAKAALRESASRLAEVSSGSSTEMEVRQIVLMQSTLSPQGSIYRALATAALGAD